MEAQNEIQQNEEKLNIIIEASALGVWELNLKTRVPKYSKRYLEIIGGYSQEVILTHEELLRHIHPDDMPIREKAFNEAMTSGRLHYESRLIWKDQSIHWMEGRGKVFYDTDNNPDFMIGTIRDITAEKEHQQKLEESEKQFRSLAESLPQLIWETDEKGNALFASGKWKEYTGITPAGEAEWKSIIHPDDYEGNAKAWMHCLETGGLYKYDVRIKNKSDQYRWHAIIGEPVYDKNHKIKKWVGSCTDIHAEKTFTHELEMQVIERTKELQQINASLKESEERYHLMVEEIQDYAILYLNDHGTIENWNLGAQKIKGYKAEEIIGKNFSIFYTESDRDSNLPQRLLTIAKETGKAKHEGWRVRKNGSLFWANVVITAIHNDQKEVIGFSKVTHDLTEKKEAEDQLKQSKLELEEKNTELEKMNKELHSFAYISSHDLQEPLRKIQAFSTLIMEKELPNLTENGKDMFNRMHSAANRMQILINDLLAYSRTNVQERTFEKTDLAKIIDEVKEDMSEELEQKHANIEVMGTCVLKIIPFQFRQLIYNLVSNALKFAKEDVPPHIKIKAVIDDGASFNNSKLSKETSYCHISVSDNGIGFEQQYSERIFEVFQRLHGRSQYTGTGIGLAIVKRIVDNHHGVITASGEKNLGATFDIYIPVL
ncbi:PAS domain-containing sensor histidine kinase [Flavobacterium sp.]|uniref:PAS domain-containing sensor histidine kinase n=1 Tax=Flavobacterium sp. TaxID=239 RepID=UPI002612B151|nr:PAS domain-containing sensor histidine kinase [Flavobacterium sp.]